MSTDAALDRLARMEPLDAFLTLDEMHDDGDLDGDFDALVDRLAERTGWDLDPDGFPNPHAQMGG